MGSYLRTDAAVVLRKAEVEMYGGLETKMSYLKSACCGVIFCSFFVTLDGPFKFARISACMNWMLRRASDVADRCWPCCSLNWIALFSSARPSAFDDISTPTI